MTLSAAPKLILSDAERQRLDESPDGQFYNTPRMMQHADDSFLQALTGQSPGPGHILFAQQTVQDCYSATFSQPWQP